MSGRWLTALALLLTAALGACSGGDDSKGDSAAVVTPAATATATPAPTPTATRAPSPSPSGASLSDFVCSLNGTCSPTPTSTATRTTTATATIPATAAPPPLPRSPTPSARPSPSASPSPPPGPPPTLAQLRRALLTEDDLGGDWAEIASGALTRQRNPAVSGEFTEIFTDEYLAVELHDARNGSTEFLGLGMIAGQGMERLDEAQPTGPGVDRIRYRYQYVDGGTRYYGEIVAWRQGAVVVAMQAEGTAATTCVCDRAAQQDAKLRAALR